MVNDADLAKRRPSGLKVIALMVSAESDAVIVTFCDRAPAGTVNVWGPTFSDPPSGPMVAVVVAGASGLHLSSPTDCSRPPSRSCCGPAATLVAAPEAG